MRRKPILCLDFDGVLHSYVSGWKGAEMIPDPPVPGAMEFLRNAVKHFDVHIYSSRSHQAGGIEAMQQWMMDHGGLELLTHIIWPKHKPAAMVTIDDRAIQFDGNWPLIENLLSFKPWNKR